MQFHKAYITGCGLGRRKSNSNKNSIINELGAKRPEAEKMLLRHRLQAFEVKFSIHLSGKASDCGYNILGSYPQLSLVSRNLTLWKKSRARTHDHAPTKSVLIPRSTILYLNLKLTWLSNPDFVSILVSRHRIFYWFDLYSIIFVVRRK